MQETLEHIAHLVKTHGRRGELVAEPVRGLPPLLVRGMEVAVLPPRLKGPRWLDVANVSGGGPSQLVAFEGVDDMEDAESLIGREVLVRASDLPRDLYLEAAGLLVGRDVTDVTMGELGIVTDVMGGPAQDVLVIEGPWGEVLLPVVPEIVREVPSRGAIVVEARRGSVGGGAS